MRRLFSLVPVSVITMPDKLEHGMLYISREFETAIHLCACGCGYKTVTPFSANPKHWVMKETDEKITLSPSIGNFQSKCKAHYFITNDEVIWVD